MSTQANCYDPAHYLSKPGSGYTPCFNDTSDGHSLCCKNGWICEDNLFCVFAGSDSSTTPQGAYARGLCTDRSFTSPNCPQFCLGFDQEIKNCGNSTGCCGNYSSNCSCLAGRPGALIFSFDHVWPNTLNTTNQSTSSNVTTKSSAPTSTSRRSSTTSPISTTSIATAPNGNTPAAPEVSPLGNTPPSSISTATSTFTSNSPPADLGIKIGIPITIIILLTASLIAIILHRRRRQNQPNQRQICYEQPSLKPPYQLPTRPASQCVLVTNKHATQYHPQQISDANIKGYRSVDSTLISDSHSDSDDPRPKWYSISSERYNAHPPDGDVIHELSASAAMTDQKEAWTRRV